MVFLASLKTELKFLLKQGVFTVYIFLTIAYLLIISFLPESANKVFIPLVVFSDPSVIGLFFIGAMMMLEKTQGIFSYLAITPLSLKSYIFSKMIAFLILSELAGFAISILSGYSSINYFVLFFGILLVSFLFTLLGFIITITCQTMNQYFLRMIPIMVIFMLPCFGLIKPNWVFLNVFPSLAGLNIMLQAYSYPMHSTLLIYGGYLALIIVVLYAVVYKKMSRLTDFKS